MRQNDVISNVVGYECNAVDCVMSRSSRYVYARFKSNGLVRFSLFHVHIDLIQKIARILASQGKELIVNKIYPNLSQDKPTQFLSFEEEFLQSPFSNKKFRPLERVYADMDLFERSTTQCVNPYHGFSCRACPNCLSARAAGWSSRLLNEADKAVAVVPVCLTYTDSMLTYMNGVMVLNRKDVSLFAKRLRKYLENTDITIKYFFKGEYGDANIDFPRPHLHGVIFFYANQCPPLEWLYSKICKAWNSALLKFYGEKYPNMERPQNLQKEYQVNPIIEIEEWSGTTSKYTTKYTAKSAIEEFSEGAKLVSEFIQCSNHIGKDFYESQIEDTRKKLPMLYEKYLKINDLASLKSFLLVAETLFTFFGRDGKPFSLPSYLKSAVFGGYWRYCECEDIWEIPIKLKKGIVCRITSETQDELKYKYWSNDNSRAVEYVDMYNYYLNNVKMFNLCNFFGFTPLYDPLSLCIVADGLPRYGSEYYLRRMTVHQLNIQLKAENRIKGQKKKIAEKIVKRSKFIKNVQNPKKGEVEIL